METECISQKKKKKTGMLISMTLKTKISVNRVKHAKHKINFQIQNILTGKSRPMFKEVQSYFLGFYFLLFFFLFVAPMDGNELKL